MVAQLLRARREMREGNYAAAEAILRSLLPKKTLLPWVLLSLSELYDWWGRYEAMKHTLVALFPHRHRLPARAAIQYREFLGIWHDMQGHLDRAARWYQRCLEEARRASLRQEESTALFNLGWIAQRKGQDHLAQTYYQASLDLAEDSFSEAVCLLRLGDLALRNGDLPHADTLYREALKRIREVNFPYWESLILAGLSRVQALLFRKEEAMRFAREADERHRFGVPVVYEIALFFLDRNIVHKTLSEETSMVEPLKTMGEVLLGQRSLQDLPQVPFTFWVAQLVRRIREHFRSPKPPEKNGGKA